MAVVAGWVVGAKSAVVVVADWTVGAKGAVIVVVVGVVGAKGAVDIGFGRVVSALDAVVVATGGKGVEWWVGGPRNVAPKGVAQAEGSLFQGSEGG